MVEFDEAEQLWSVGVETYRMGAAFLRRRKLVDRARIGHAGTDGEDRRDRQSRRRRGRLRGLRQPGRDASGDPRLLPAGHAQPVSCIRHRQGDPGASVGRTASTAIIAQDRAAKPSPTRRLSRRAGARRATSREIRARGWSVDDEERHPGMRCVAAAIFNEFGEPIGGISISGPTVRVTPERLAAIGPAGARRRRGDHQDDRRGRAGGMKPVRPD